MTSHPVSGVTCLGCGLLCDDVTVTVTDGRIDGIAPECARARTWFGDGRVPGAIRVAGADATFDAALAAAAARLDAARGRVVVALGPGLSIAAIRAGIALADRLRAAIDTATSPAAAAAIVAGQRRGRAAATLGEFRNRAEMLLFWHADPDRTHPRFTERIAPAPRGTHVREPRTVACVQVGGEAGAMAAELHLALDPALEAQALAVMRAVVLGAAGEVPPPLSGAADLARRLLAAHYVGIVAGGEGDAPGAALRAEGLIALAQALNGPTRAALLTLRDGGNRNGVESALTWQTGFPFAVSYAGGAPTYDPDGRALARPGHGPVLVLGDWRGFAPGAFEGREVVVVGPRASDAPFAAAVAIDTGVAGIHEGGTAYRLDDVPLPLTPVLDAARTAAMVVSALGDAVASLGRGAP